MLFSFRFKFGRGEKIVGVNLEICNQVHLQGSRHEINKKRKKTKREGMRGRGTVRFGVQVRRWLG